MTAKTQDYVTKAAGWVAGKYRAEGTKVQLTAAQAKYENVILASETGPKEDSAPAKAATEAGRKGSRAKK